MAPPKKVAAKHADPKHHEMKDLRRAYEHLGRVELLQKLTGQRDKDVSTLASLAQKELSAGHGKEAADLLRAAEHLSFAALGATATNSSELSPKLEEAVQDKFDRLIEKAEEDWEHKVETSRHREGLPSTAARSKQHGRLTSKEATDAPSSCLYVIDLGSFLRRQP